jgi:hypothetical protein
MTGAKAAQPIWNDFMAAYLKTLTDAERAEDFQVPAGIVFTPVDAMTGERAVPPCSYQENVILEAFLDGTEPVDPCNEEMGEVIDLPWPFQLPFYVPKPGEPMPNSDAIEVADDRLRPTPTAEERAEIERLTTLEGPEAAERYRLKMGVRRPEEPAETANQE